MALAPTSSAINSAQSAFGLDFQSLLKIILTQLTYQDPLKPLDNQEFVSQLAQFSQLQQTQSLNDQITSLLSSQAATQATGLLAKTVDVSTSGATITGTVTAISFKNSQPTMSVKTTDGQTIDALPIANITKVQ